MEKSIRIEPTHFIEVYATKERWKLSPTETTLKSFLPISFLESSLRATVETECFYTLVVWKIKKK